MRAKAFPIAALRGLVVLPSACMEGALAVALPWLVAKATLGTVWLGVASTGLVLASMLGALVAPVLERGLRNRRMMVITAFAVVAALALAALCWIWKLPALAYGSVLLAVAADAACDLGFSSRMPLLARLSAQRLEQFSATNWLWGIVGAASGSVLAGWAVAGHHVTPLAVGLVVLSLVVAVGLTLLLPRESRAPVNTRPLLRALFDRQFWTPGALKVAAVLTVVVFFAGPIDNLLLPAHLAARGLPADLFGDMLATVGVGLAVGLWWMQRAGATAAAHDVTNGHRRTQHRWVSLGLWGLTGQLAVMLWLPQPWLLLPGLFVTACLFAPVLPTLEAAMLRAVGKAQRTLMLAALSTLVGLADAIGTLSFGGLMNFSSSAMALGVCLSAASAAGVVHVFWPRPWAHD